MLKRYAWLFIISVLLVSLLTGFIGCDSESSQKVDIPDPQLRSAIKKALGKSFGSIHTSDLEKLTELQVSPDGSRPPAYRKYVYDITGLEYCLNLTELDLKFNGISDISPLTHIIINVHVRSVYSKEG